MSNWSDRGGAGPSAEVLRQLHREDLDRHNRGEQRPIEIGDVRELDSERIAELGERYGTIAAASAIAAAATKQLANIKISVATLPSGQKLHRVGDGSHLTADDCDWLNTRALSQAHMRAVMRETSVKETLLRWVKELCGDHHTRAVAVLRAIGDDGIDKLMKVHKRDRRKALARVLEELGKIKPEELEIDDE